MLALGTTGADLYTSDGTHHQTSDITSPSWTNVGRFDLEDTASLNGMVGGSLPWDQNQNRFYSFGPTSWGPTVVQEGSLNNNDWIPKNLNFQAYPVGQTPLVAVAYQNAESRYIVSNGRISGTLGNSDLILSSLGRLCAVVGRRRIPSHGDKLRLRFRMEFAAYYGDQFLLGV